MKWSKPATIFKTGVVCNDIVACSGNYIVPYDAGLGDKLSSTVDAFESNGHTQNASTWAQLKEANSEKLAYYLDELNKQLAEIDK